MGCTADDGEDDLSFLDDPSTRVETAHAIVPFGEPQTALVPFPEEMLVAFLECTENAVGGDLVIIARGETVADPAQADQQWSQQVAASDCALEHGLDEFAPIWTPVARSDVADAIERWQQAAQFCMAEVGVDDPPVRDFGDGYTEPDFALVIGQDPSLEDPLRACMRDQGEDFPGDE